TRPPRRRLRAEHRHLGVELRPALPRVRRPPLQLLPVLRRLALPQAPPFLELPRQTARRSHRRVGRARAREQRRRDHHGAPPGRPTPPPAGSILVFPFHWSALPWLRSAHRPGFEVLPKPRIGERHLGSPNETPMEFQ